MPTTILVTGSTGYVGGRLVPRLLARGETVRCLVRDPARLAGRSWSSKVEVMTGNLLFPPSLESALQGVSVAYYFVHSLAQGKAFADLDAQAAANFAHAAAQAGVQRIIYLGGLGEESSRLSGHLRSRHQTGEILRAGTVPVTEFRAGVVVGSGSLSFEMIRYLCERLPVMICPQWVYTKTQPIAIRDVLEYLIGALDTPESSGRIIEIGGSDVVTYGEMLKIYAEERGLPRYMLPVPVLTPRLSSYWVHLVTPVPTSIARPLIEGLKNELTVRSPVARDLFPQISPLNYREAVRRALEKLNASAVETSWSDSLVSSLGARAPVILTEREGMIIESRELKSPLSSERIFASVTSLGGDVGWLYMDWAWDIRGLLDRVCGGVGMRRGRRHPSELRPGDALDFWRVEALESNKLLRLRAEMKVPGSAWLQFSVEPLAGGGSLLKQVAFFAPRGFSGLLYWYLLYPIHALIFSGIIRAIEKRARTTT